MGRIAKLLGLGLLAVLIIIQFFQPERNNTPADPELDMLSLVSPPEATAPGASPTPTPNPTPT